MTKPESPDTVPESDAPETPAEAAAPAPEPWTPARVLEWNAYYDLYVALGVLLLAFVASANKITYSTIWTQLQAGRLIAATGAPVVTDPFSYTEEGRRWVNVPWLFEWSHALLHQAVYDLAPADPTEPAASSARAEQLGAGALIALAALLRAATVLVVLAIRRPGPGLWWSALCATVALGAIFSPVGWTLGGIAGPARVSPETWGLLLLAVELLLLHRAINLGRRNLVFALVPLFLLWANLDESFLIGLLILAAVVVGRLAPGRADESGGLSFPRGLAVLGASAVACLINPSTYRAYAAAAEPIVNLFKPSGGILTSDQLSYFGKTLRGDGPSSGWLSLVGYYGLLVAVGVGSFALNRRRFSPGRFLAFAVASALWGALLRYGDVFAVVFAATVALNGQEWYLDAYGTRGRLGRGWVVWSIGGRAVTIVVVFLLVARALTGYGRSPGEPPFGFGYNPDDFPFEAADFLKTAKIEGRVLNTSILQGDAIIWRASPDRKTFLDGRPHLFPPAIQRQLQETRRDLSTDAVAGWRPVLDRYRIGAVMIHEATAPKTYRTLMQSANWIPFYDDGNVVMFGRADASASDLAFFRANRLDPEVLAYRRSRPVPAVERPPTAMTWMDAIFRNRSLVRPQSHGEVARRWLEGPATDGGAAALPEPARCFLAIREARTALSRKPDDPLAYRLLATAYRDLMIQEAALLAGITPTPATAERVRQVHPSPGLLMNRFRQRVTALNYAIQTTPPADSQPERRELIRLNMELYQLFLEVNYSDLARDRLRAVVAANVADDLPAEVIAGLKEELARLDQRIKQVQEAMDAETEERQAGPLQRAGFALSQGAPGLALLEFEEALQSGVSPSVVKPQLLDLYCDTGQPDRALELIGGGNIDDPSLGAEPGRSAMRQGRVYALLGNYEYASTLWEKNALRQLRFDRSIRAFSAAQAYLRGEPKAATSALLSIPEQITTQAYWEDELALCRLESGMPELAAEPFTQALTLAPKLGTRPIIAYYLEKLGKPVPPVPETEATPSKPEIGQPLP